MFEECVSVWGAKPPKRKERDSLGMFKNLDIYIQMYSESEKEENDLRAEINQHMAGIIRYEELSVKAKQAWDDFEQYMKERK